MRRKIVNFLDMCFLESGLMTSFLMDDNKMAITKVNRSPCFPDEPSVHLSNIAVFSHKLSRLAHSCILDTDIKWSRQTHGYLQSLNRKQKNTAIYRISLSDVLRPGPAPFNRESPNSREVKKAYGFELDWKTISKCVVWISSSISLISSS